MKKWGIQDFMAQLLRKRQQDEQSRRESEPSYYDDRREGVEKDSKRPARSASESRPRPSAKPDGEPDRMKPARAETGDAKGAFDSATDAVAVKQQQEFDRRFKSEETREAALEAREDAQTLREQVEKQFQERSDVLWDQTQRMLNDPRPWPLDASRDLNSDRMANRDWKVAELARIDRNLETAFSQIAVLDVVIAPNFGPNKKRLETTYETDPTADFNDAAALDVWTEPVPPDTVIHMHPDAAPADDIGPDHEAAPVTDWVAEFNKAARPREEGPGIRP